MIALWMKKRPTLRLRISFWSTLRQWSSIWSTEITWYPTLAVLFFFFVRSFVCLGRSYSLITLEIMPRITTQTRNTFPSVFLSQGKRSTIMWIPELLHLLWGSNFSLSSLPDLRVEDSPKAHYVYHPPSPALRANQTNCWTVYCVTYAKTTSSRFPLLETSRSKSAWCPVGFRVCACVCVQERDREIR